jgi:hypothetical protein
MDDLARLLLRFILVPLGYFGAVLAGTLVLLFGAWKIGQTGLEIEDRTIALYGYLFVAPVLLVTLLSVMWLPSSIGILISEAFALRSWMFHAANGAVSAWIGWNLFGYIDESRIALNGPLAIIAAGLAGGLAYWAIAGWSAGFWRPVFRRRTEAAALEPASPPPQIR